MFLAQYMQSAYATKLLRAHEGPFVPILDFWTISEPVKDSIGQYSTQEEIISPPLFGKLHQSSTTALRISWAYRPRSGIAPLS